MENSMTWDEYFLGMAEYASIKSKDPSTKVGVVIVDQYNRVVSLGFNGFPRGVEDSPDRYADREQKYPRVVHAEANAVVASRQDLFGCRIYCTLFPCNECAKLIIQAGISEVVCLLPAESNDRWSTSHELSQEMFSESGVKFRWVKT